MVTCKRCRKREEMCRCYSDPRVVRVNEQGDRQMAIRHGTACKSNIPEWAGEGVGIVGIVYLVYAMPTYETVRPGDDQNVGT